MNVEQKCNELGTSMERTWNEHHGINVERTWKERGTNIMELTWNEHGMDVEQAIAKIRKLASRYFFGEIKIVFCKITIPDR